MALYLVEYDLIKRKDYQSLTDALVALRAKKVLLSSWALRHTNTNPKALRDHFLQFIDADDRLCVYEAVENWANWNALNDINTL